MIPFERDPGFRRHGWEHLGDRFGRASGGLERRANLDLSRPRAPRPECAESRIAWLVGPLLLASVAAGMLYAFRGPDHLFGIALGVVMGLGFLWILVSVLFPARPDRTCPRCGNRALERLDPGSVHGLRCHMCQWENADAASFLLVEEEDAFEDALPRDSDGDHPRRW